MCWRYTTYFLLKNTKNSLFFFSCLRFSLIFHSSIVCAEARFQLPLRIIAVLLFCMCLYCHPLLGSLSHHVCCCHCWFMRQLWRRISLLSLRQGFVVLLFLSSTYISAENTNQRLCHLIDIKDNHNKTSKEMINALLIKFDWIRMFCSYTNHIFFTCRSCSARNYSIWSP